MVCIRLAKVAIFVRAIAYVLGQVRCFNPLMNTGNYSATSNNMKLMNWSLMGGWYSEEGTGRGRSPPRPLLAVLNVTGHPSTASEPTTVFLYNGGPLLCGFNVPIKGLMTIKTAFVYTNESQVKSNGGVSVMVI